MNHISLTCHECAKTYTVQPHRRLKSKYCDIHCRAVATGRFAGSAGKGVTRNKGAKHPYLAEYNRTHIKRGAQIANWRGDDADYITIHIWFARNFGKPSKCEHCGSTNNIQWSNKDHKYRRVRDDWQQLCSSCHQRYDHANLPTTANRFYEKRRKQYLSGPKTRTYALKEVGPLPVLNGQ